MMIHGKEAVKKRILHLSTGVKSAHVALVYAAAWPIILAMHPGKHFSAAAGPEVDLVERKAQQQNQ